MLQYILHHISRLRHQFFQITDIFVRRTFLFKFLFLTIQNIQLICSCIYIRRIKDTDNILLFRSSHITNKRGVIGFRRNNRNGDVCRILFTKFIGNITKCPIHVANKIIHLYFLHGQRIFGRINRFDILCRFYNRNCIHRLFNLVNRLAKVLWMAKERERQLRIFKGISQIKQHALVFIGNALCNRHIHYLQFVNLITAADIFAIFDKFFDFLLFLFNIIPKHFNLLLIFFNLFLVPQKQD